MALNINGTTGISGVDGSASAPALQGTDSNTGVSFGTDTVNINTGGTTRATVDSSGNLGIGTTSPSFKLTVNSAENNLFLKQDSGDHGYILDVNQSDGSLAFNRRSSGSDTERLLINSAGDIMCGSSTVEVGRGNTTIGVTLRPEGRVYYNSNGSFSSFGRNSDNAVLVFTRSGTDVGNISVTSSATSYNTGSDYRLKENVTAISDGITRLKTLKPSRFNFKAKPDTIVDGFIAHEVTAVPEAITGTKDAVVTQSQVDSKEYTEKELGNPIYQGIDQSKLVPLLTAALQEAVAKIEVLETKVAALEAG